MSMKRVALFLIVVAVVLVPAATAASSSHHRAIKVKLPLIPLQTAQLGAAGAALPVGYDSGTISNADAASQTVALVSPATFKKLGRLNGYLLDYGDPLTGDAGVTEIATSVEEYKTPADAKKGLAFWKKDDGKIATLSADPLTITAAKAALPAVGSGHYGYLVTYSTPGVNPFYSIEERLTDNRFVLEVYVSAGSAAAAQQLAPALAKKLVARLHSALAGHLKATAVKIPNPPANGGPPPDGPDLSTLIVQASDVGQNPIVNLLQGYNSAYPAISDYSMILTPAGPFDDLLQDISWYPTAAEATWSAAFAQAGLVGFFGLIQGVTVTPVDITAAGDNGIATIISAGSGQGGIGFVELTRGQAVDSVTVDSSTDVNASDVQSLATAMASRLDPGIP